MILDKYITNNNKIYISIISGIIWIYYRDKLCYELLPRKNILTSLVVGVWIYLNYKEPLFLPIGLLLCFVYSLFYR
jgi:hypothetical protein